MSAAARTTSVLQPVESAPKEARLRTFGLCAIGAALLALFWPLGLGRLFLYADLGGAFLPLRMFFAERLARGESPLWMPHLFCGFYVHGEGQLGIYHPLRRMSYALLPVDAAFALECLLPYPLALLGFVLLLRRLGLPGSAALFGGLCLGLAPFLTLRLTHLDTIAVLAHVPWLLLASDVLLRAAPGTRRQLAFVWIALLTGSQLLAGYPPAVLLSLLVEGAYAASLARRGAAAALLLLLAAKGVGVLLGAPQWLPTWEEIESSQRATASAEFRLSQSLHPLNLLLPLSPWLFRDRVYQVESFNPIEQAFYLGAVVPVALAWLLARAPQLAAWQRHAVRALLVACALALVLALGRYLPVYPLLIELPVFGLFRVPARFTWIITLAGAFLAALAFGDLRGAPAANGASARALRALWIAPLLACGIAGVALALRQEPASPWPGGLASIPPAWPLLAGPLLLALAAALFHAAARGVRVALPALFAFAAVDLVSYGATLWWSEPPLTLAEYRASVPRAPSVPPERLLTQYTMVFERTPDGVAHYREVTRRIVHDTRLVTGYIGLAPERVLDYSQRGALRLAGASHAEVQGRYQRLAPPFARARLVAHSVVSADPARALQSVDLERTAIVAIPLALGGGAPGTASVLEDTAGRIRVRTEAATRQLLVLTESYHPGWQARCDGAPCRSERVYGDFLGAVVEPGAHEIELRFAPDSVERGFRLAGLGLIGLTLPLAARTRRRRRDP